MTTTDFLLEQSSPIRSAESEELPVRLEKKMNAASAAPAPSQARTSEQGSGNKTETLPEEGRVVRSNLDIFMDRLKEVSSGRMSSMEEKVPAVFEEGASGDLERPENQGEEDTTRELETAPQPLLRLEITPEILELHRLIQIPSDIHPFLRILSKTMVSQENLRQYEAVAATLKEINSFIRENQKKPLGLEVRINGRRLKDLFSLVLDFDGFELKGITLIELYLTPFHETSIAKAPTNDAR